MIAALMEFSNYLAGVKEMGMVTTLDWNESIDTIMLLLAPTAPHLAEELWQQTGHQYSIHNQPWPVWDLELARDEEITLVIQVNGKLRDRVTASASINEAEAKDIAQNTPRAKTYLEGREIVKLIYVPGKLVNIVVR
jgi:leucyl-tRNA synthetase